MVPYYQDHQTILYHCDARDIIGELKADLIVADFPYAISENYDCYVDSEENLLSLVDLISMFKCTALVTCGVGNIYKFPKPKWILAWTTPAGAGSGPWGFCCWQPILAYGDDPYLKNCLGRRADLYSSTELSKHNGHPCPKPSSFSKWLILRGSIKESDIVLDPLCGSGSFLVAAKQLGRKAIGIDISKKYLDIAIDRLRQEVIPFKESEQNEREMELLF